MTEVEDLLSRLRDIETFTADQQFAQFAEGEEVCPQLIAQTMADAVDTITMLMVALEGLVKGVERDYNTHGEGHWSDSVEMQVARAALLELGL